MCNITAQKIITWQKEGLSYPQNRSYVGSRQADSRIQNSFLPVQISPAIFPAVSSSSLTIAFCPSSSRVLGPETLMANSTSLVVLGMIGTEIETIPFSYRWLRSNWFFGSSEVLLIFTGTRAAQTAWSTFGAQLASTNGMGGSADGATGTLGFNNGFLFVMLGMMIGIILFYALQKLSKAEFSAGARAALTVANVFCSVLLMWYTIYQPTYFLLDRWTVSFLCIAVVGLSLLNKDGLTSLLNNGATNKLFAYLGSISLYVYMLHYPVGILVLRVLGKNTEATTYSFWQVFLPTTAVTLVLSVMTKIAMEKTILKKK